MNELESLLEQAYQAAIKIQRPEARGGFDSIAETCLNGRFKSRALEI